MVRKKRITWIIVSIVLVIALNGCAVRNSSSENSEDHETYTELSEGSDAPDFTAEINDGSSFTLSDYQGEVILLNFWATWCGPCVNEMPAFQRLYEEYGDKIKILAVNSSEEKGTVDAFIEETGYTFPIAYDEDGEIGKKYPTEGIPYTLVIGRDGKVSAVFLGADGADEQYKKYRSALKEAYSEQE